MTSPCWICSNPGTVHVQGNSYVCHNHWNGTGEPYLEEGHID